MFMKKVLFVLTAAALTMPAFSAGAATPCKKREAAIQAELALAKQNNGDVAGLEEALANHRTTCNDDNLLSKAKIKVQEKQLKVSKAEMELEEAQSSGKADKIAKKQEKLREARIDLQEAQARLAELQ